MIYRFIRDFGTRDEYTEVNPSMKLVLEIDDSVPVKVYSL
jgi:hypothetical protein